MELRLPTDPVSGNEHLRLGCPWITNESIVRLDSLLKPTYKVLEFGSGGSTVFFSRRTKHVLSYETNYVWAKNVTNKLTEENLTNYTLVQYSDKKTLLRLLKALPAPEDIDVISVDSAWYVVDRDYILAMLSSLSFKPSILVLDNYVSPRGNPQSFRLNEEEFAEMFPLVRGMTVETYDFKGWAGKGTRIYHNQGSNSK
jgi:hypothetical protein